MRMCEILRTRLILLYFCRNTRLRVITTLALFPGIRFRPVPLSLVLSPLPWSDPSYFPRYIEIPSGKLSFPVFFQIAHSGIVQSACLSFSVIYHFFLPFCSYFFFLDLCLFNRFWFQITFDCHRYTLYSLCKIFLSACLTRLIANKWLYKHGG